MLPLFPLFFLSQTTSLPLPLRPPNDSRPTVIIPSIPSRPPRPLPPPEELPPLESLPTLEAIPPLEVMQPSELRPLPGQLDSIPVFNSNSPELVQTEGVLLSTFPPDRMRFPRAHLNFKFSGRFDIFTHHVTRARTPEQTRSLIQGIILYNPTSEPVTVDLLQGASYLTRPDALFVNLPPIMDNPLGTVFAGPGSRTMNDVLRGRRQGSLPNVVFIPPRESRMLLNLPIPPGTVVPTSNGRSTLLRLWSNGPVYIANLAMFAPKNPDGTERIPTLAEWQNLLVNADLAGPRDLAPTPLEDSVEDMIYGRVAGVAQGSQWRAQLTDSPKVEYLTIPKPGRTVSYGLSTLHRGRLGTGQIQSALMLARYPDTAYYAHGNYGIEYDLKLPLYNATKKTQTVVLTIQTPIKDDRAQGALLFLKPEEDRIFFRGTVRLSYQDDRGLSQVRYVHLVQKRGQTGEPLLKLNLPPQSQRKVEVDFLYPPDATPPQVLTVQTLPR